MGAVLIGHLEVANNFLSICECFSGSVAITLRQNVVVICRRSMPASLVSDPHSRTTAVTVNNRGGKAAMICIAKTSLIDSKLLYICKIL